MHFTRTQQAINTPLDNATNGIVATNVQTAIEEVRALAMAQRFVIALTNNGGFSNNQRVAYNELLTDTPVVIPKASILREIVFANNRPSYAARFFIYRRNPPQSSATPGGTATLLRQWDLTDVLTARLSGLSYTFSAGDELLITFDNVGGLLNNPADTVITCFFQAT